MSKALVIPFDMSQPVKVIEWPPVGDTLDVLYHHTECQTVDLVRGQDYGIWCDDEFLFRGIDQFNPRASLVSIADSAATPLMGTVVVTRVGTNDDGDTLGLTDDDVARIRELVRATHPC